jgi:predicted ester cyclase
MIDKWIEKFIEEGERALAVRDWETYGGIFTEDFKMVTPMLSGVITGREARIQLAQGIFTSFPNGEVKVQRAFGKGEWACVEVMFTGTHTGPMPGPDGSEIPPTGKHIEWPYCMVIRFQDGLVRELYEYYDQGSLFNQLGLM